MVKEFFLKYYHYHQALYVMENRNEIVELYHYADEIGGSWFILLNIISIESNRSLGKSRYNMFFVMKNVIKIWQLFLRLTTCLTSTLLETGVGANDCKICCQDQRLNKTFKARWSSG
jgi:hypothetical protein